MWPPLFQHSLCCSDLELNEPKMSRDASKASYVTQYFKAVHLTKKWTNTFIRHFPKENILIVSRYNKWFRKLLNITEMQIKPRVRYLLMTIRMTTIKKTQNNCCWEYDKKKTLHIVHKNAHCCNYYVKYYICLQKLYIYIYI